MTRELYQDSKQMKPTVGRNVHYVAYGSANGEFQAGKHRAAIITDVDDISQHVCCLRVFHPMGDQVVPICIEDSTGTIPGTWHWPEREV